MQYNDNGSLTIRTYTAGGALPVAKATVRITGANEENRFIEYTVLTDVDGITEAILLPTPALIYSTAPDSAEIPYATYELELSADGYYTKRIHDVAIFSGINSMQSVNMIPLPTRVSTTTYPRDNLDATVVENSYLYPEV